MRDVPVYRWKGWKRMIWGVIWAQSRRQRVEESSSTIDCGLCVPRCVRVEVEVYDLCYAAVACETDGKFKAR